MSMDKVVESLGPLLNKLSPEDAQTIKDNLARFKTNLEQSRVTGEAGAGLVKITTNGYGEPISVEIDPLVFKEEETQLVSDLFCAALRDNLKRCQEHAVRVESELRRELLLGKLQ